MRTVPPRSGGLVLLINPNTNEDTTSLMATLAEGEFAGSGFELLAVTVPSGPRMIVDSRALTEAGEQVRRTVHEVLASEQGARVAAVIVAAFGDPGRSMLAREIGIPVVGIGQASILAAARGGRRFGMATTTPRLLPSLERLAHEHAEAGLFCGVETTASGPLQLASDPEAQFAELQSAALRSWAAGARAVIIAGGPLSDAARRLAAGGAVEIIEPIPSACALIRELL
ncbi:aspartate/glutamate racemase family protein [Arthrobacter rhombi]|uniref:aspartate/glutamate racemase family protein n=1 Tax=Arthrobacter rhombi TaxID=71253 RepID=UPI003FD40C68